MTADHITRAADEISGIQIGTGYESVTIDITAALEAAQALDAAGLLATPIAGGGYDCTCEGNVRCEKTQADPATLIDPTEGETDE